MQIVPRMRGKMQFQFGCIDEASITECAHLWAIAGMQSSVCGQMRAVCECFFADITLVRPWIFMPFHMEAMCTLMNKTLSTNVAREVLLAGMHDNVRGKQ